MMMQCPVMNQTDYKSAWSYAEGTTKRIMFIVEGVDQEQI